MILYCVSGVIPYDKIKVNKLDKIQDIILERLKKNHPDCSELQNPYVAEDIVITFENDGVYYQLDIEA